MSKIKIINEFKHFINQIKKNTHVSVGIDGFNPNINKYHHDTIKSGYWDAMKKKNRSEQAVSEVIGIVLLLGITVTLFTALNFNVSQFFFGTSIPLVNLVGTIDKNNTNYMISIQHNGGESLEGTTQIIITIGSDTYRYNTSDKLTYEIDINHDLKWNLGETLQFSTGITQKYIGVTVMDSNAILLSVVLQDGSS